MDFFGGKFMIDFEITNITIEKATEVCLSNGVELDKFDNGFWQIKEAFEMDSILVNGNFSWLIKGFSDESEDVHKLRKYAVKIITPMIDLKQIDNVKFIMNALFKSGALITSRDAIKIYFMGNRIPTNKTRHVLKELVKGNYLMKTVLFFPHLFSNLLETPIVRYCEEAGGTNVDQLDASLYNIYTEIIMKLESHPIEDFVSSLYFSKKSGAIKASSNDSPD